MIDQFIATWCRISIQASVLLILVLLVTQLFGRWLTPRVRFWLWGLVLLRFLIPFAPVSGLSLYGLFTAVSPETVAQVPQTADAPAVRSANHGVPPMMPLDLPHVMTNRIRKTVVEPIDQTENVPSHFSRTGIGTDHSPITVEQEEPPVASDFPWAKCAALIWLIGAA